MNLYYLGDKSSYKKMTATELRASYLWCMGGENQAFTDMDIVAMDMLR